MRKILCKLILIITTLFILFYKNDINTWADTYTVVPGTSTTLPIGTTFNQKIKRLYKSSAYSSTTDNYITNIIWTNIDFSSESHVANLITNGGIPIYARLNGTVVELYTTAETIYLNQNCKDMFEFFEALQQIDFLDNRINTSKCTNFGNMFFSCGKLKSLDLYNWDVSNINNFSDMFASCRNLTSLDLSNWNVSNGTNFSRMFHLCTSLTSTGDLSNWDVSNNRSFYEMFDDCDNLTFIGDLSNWNVSNCSNFKSMFRLCSDLKSIGDLSNWNVSKGTKFDHMFTLCTDISSIGDLHNWNVSKCTNFESMFYACWCLEFLGDLSSWNVSKCTTFNQMFYDCHNLTSIGNLSNWNVGKCTNFEDMFYNCYKLTYIGDLSSWNVSSGTSFYQIFYKCQKLTSIGDLSNWNVSNGTNFSRMFYNCNNVTSLDLSNWDVSNCTRFDDMFYGCKKLTSLDLSNWNVSKGTKFYSMFSCCFELTSIGDISNWDVSNGTNFNSMFNNTKITELDISNWNITVEKPFNTRFFPSTLKKVKMCNTTNISEDSLKNLFSNDMVLDNNEDGIGDDNIVRRDAIKDVNTTDKQIYIIVPTFTIYLHSNDILNSADEYVNDSKVIELTINVNNPSDLVSKLLPAIQELKNDGYLHDDGYLVTDLLYSGTLPSDSLNASELSIRNGTINQADTRNNNSHIQPYIFYGHIPAWLTSENAIASNTFNYFTTRNEEYHFYVINPIYNIKVHDININNNIKLNNSWFHGQKIYYGDNLIYYNPNVEIPIFDKQFEYDLINNPNGK